MDKLTAIYQIIYQARTERLSLTKYKAACRACIALDLSPDDQRKALARLGYLREDNGEPYEWLRQKLAEKRT